MKREYGRGIFEGVDSVFFLLGLLSAFENQYQSKLNRYFQGISWKQFLILVSIKLFKESPTLGEVAQVVKSSHQNVRQILKKLEEKGYVDLIVDSKDQRKQRVSILEKGYVFLRDHDQEANNIVANIYQGIEEENIQTTIETILQMERNLGKL